MEKGDQETGRSRSFFSPEYQLLLDHMTQLSKTQFNDPIPFLGRNDHFLCVSLGKHTIPSCDASNSVSWFGVHLYKYLIDGELESLVLPEQSLSYAGCTNLCPFSWAAGLVPF